MRRAFLWSLTAICTAAYLVAGVVAVLSTGFELQGWLWLIFGPPVFLAAGLLLFVKRPGHAIGELLLLMALTTLVIPQIFEIPVVLRFQDAGPESWMWAPMWGAQTLTAIGVILGAAIIALLPDGRFRYRRERLFLAVVSPTVVLPSLSLVSNPLLVRSEELSFPGVTDIPSPLVIDALEPSGATLAGLSTLPYAAFIGGVVLLLTRHRRATVRERKQIRWVLWAGVVAVATGITPVLLGALGLMEPMTHGLAGFVLFLPALLLPISIVAAVLEPSWIDIDIVIRKSFVYGALSFLILLVYIAVAASLGLAAGWRLPIEATVVITVVVAILFQPVRRRLQGVADRWVFGERPTRYEVMTDFGATIEAVSDPEELLQQLVETVRRATRAGWVHVEFDSGASAKSGQATGEAAISVPIRSRGDQIGRIDLGRSAQRSFDSEDVGMIHALAGQVGLAVTNARLAARIVNAAESERRRIEHNIHDGAQQELVALVARLGVARAEAARSKPSPDVLAELQREASQILSDLRDLAQGIHPALLTDAGLLEAVEERCSRLPIDVSLKVAPDLRTERFRDEVEGAAYFFITEAITNVMKHSQATSAQVSLRRDNGRLRLSVSDNGRGFVPESVAHEGLTGLQDRIAALGGTFEISSSPGNGTRITATLPVS